MPFPEIEPYAAGHLTVDDGSELWWETSGSPDGQPVLWLHGGPGSGLGTAYRRRLDPARWRVVGLDQRACGRSRPLVTDPGFDLTTLTTTRMIADVEALREHLGIERWLVSGASWGATLALAYAQAHRERVSGLALLAVTTTSRTEVEWITESMRRIFPREWEEFAAASGREPGQRVLDAYLERLTDEDPEVRAAAALAWCTWEDVHVSAATDHEPSPRYEDPDFRLLFASHVVHCWCHHAFLGDHGIRDRVGLLADLPAVLIHGRRDVSGPLDTAYDLHRAWPASRLVVLDEGHGGPGMVTALEDAYTALG